MRLYRCSKKVLSFKGDVQGFLNAYTSNTPEKPKAAFLDRGGKIVAMADQVLIDPTEALVVVESKFLERLLGHLKVYVGLSRIEVKLRESFKVYFDLEGSYQPGPNEWVIPQKKGQLILTENELPAEVSEEEFTRFRLEIGLPVQGIDFDEEMLLCVADEEVVSYAKGCYLGQEIIARVHHRSKPPKKLMVKNEEDCSPQELKAMTSVWPDPKTGKKRGFVFCGTISV